MSAAGVYPLLPRVLQLLLTDSSWPVVRVVLHLPALHHMQDYIARFGHGTRKLARQAQSKEKVLSKMVAGGLTEKVVSDKVSMGD